MAFSSDKLLAQLDQPEIIEWALELQHREEAYSFILRAVKSGELNLNQIRNALHALFRIGYHNHAREILQEIIAMAGHPDRSIRSDAVQLAVGLVSWNAKWDKASIALSADQDKALRRALQNGVTPK